MRVSCASSLSSAVVSYEWTSRVRYLSLFVFGPELLRAEVVEEAAEVVEEVAEEVEEMEEVVEAMEEVVEAMEAMEENDG